MTLVAGVDTSTQSCKVVIRDAESGELVRGGKAPHPSGTEVDPGEWLVALRRAVDDAGGLGGVEAIAVGGQQHGMVCLDAGGSVVRPALTWNDTRSADAATQLVVDLGDGDESAGRQRWASAVGVVPVASYTASKLRWLADHEPHSADRTVAVCLPHDWLTWQLAGAPGIDALVTDRGDASGTGYWSAATQAYRPDLFELAFRDRSAALPRVADPAERVGTVDQSWNSGITTVLGPGTGDNAAAALGLDAQPGDVVVSIGTSGVVSAVSDAPTADPTGVVAGFADATGRQLPLVCTLNAARVLDATAAVLGVDHDGLAALALSAPWGSDGLVMVPYLEGERTPNRPDATGAVHGLTLRTSTRAHLARAAVEGLLCSLADGIDALIAQGVDVRRVLLIGGGARSAAVQQLAPGIFGRPVAVPEHGEYVADGAARQAAWILSGAAAPPVWQRRVTQELADQPHPEVRDRYAQVRDLTDGV